MPCDQPGYDPLHKITPVLVVINQTFARNYMWIFNILITFNVYAYHNVTFEENIVSISNQIKSTIFIDNKPYAGVYQYNHMTLNNI